MFIEVTTGNAEDKKNYMRKLLRTFIETKMKTYSELEAQNADQDVDGLQKQNTWQACGWFFLLPGSCSRKR